MKMNTNYSNKLNLEEFFYWLREEIYVVVKFSEIFPNYYPYSDVDIFCFDLQAVAGKILKIGNSYVSRGFKIVTNCYRDGTKAHIDFIPDAGDERLDFRFDLLTRLPEYKRMNLKPTLFYSILENRTCIKRSLNGADYDLWVPSKEDEVLLRYIEYLEWYEQRPDKLKHLEFVLSKLEEEPELKRFIDKLHLYTELRQLEISEQSHFEAATGNYNSRILNHEEQIHGQTDIPNEVASQQINERLNDQKAQPMPAMPNICSKTLLKRLMNHFFRGTLT